MRKIAPFVAALAVVLLATTGCETVPQTPDQKIATVARTIQIGTSAATSIGLLAIPNAVEADEIATLTVDVLEANVIPLLHGDEQALVAGLTRLLDLSILDNPKLAKIKLLLATALPLLQNNLPGTLVENATNKLRPDAKAYIEAFFTGILDGAEAYLGTPRGSRAALKFQQLRIELAK
jgi:hypothetical protein